MFVDGKDPRNTFALIAIDGEIVGYLAEAHIARKADGGYVVLIDRDDPTNEAKYVRRAGDVIYLGDARHVDGLAARRLSEQRERLGLTSYRMVGEPADHYARMLEHVALQIRRDEVEVTNIAQDMAIDRLPLPDDTMFVPTGEHSVAVSYKLKDVVAAHARIVQQWSKDHPDLVPEYVRSKTEGSASKKH